MWPKRTHDNTRIQVAFQDMAESFEKNGFKHPDCVHLIKNLV